MSSNNVLLIDKYEELQSNAIKKYGEFGIGTLIVRLEYLIYLIQNDFPVNHNVREELVANILKHYNYERVPNSTLQKYITKIEKGDKTLYSFEKNYFMQRYGAALPGAGKNTIQINDSSDVSSLINKGWYLYVIDQNENLLIYNDPLNTVDLVLNRNDIKYNEVPIVHPILVYDRDLTVMAAGEIFFIGVNGELKGIIANTKSGHFRPSPNSSDVIEKVLSEIFPFNRNSIILVPVGLEL